MDLWRLRDRTAFLSFSELRVDAVVSVDICFDIVGMDNEGIILNVVSSLDCRYNNVNGVGLWIMAMRRREKLTEKSAIFEERK